MNDRKTNESQLVFWNTVYYLTSNGALWCYVSAGFHGRNKDAIARGGGSCLLLPHTGYGYGRIIIKTLTRLQIRWEKENVIADGTPFCRDANDTPPLLRQLASLKQQQQQQQQQ